MKRNKILKNILLACSILVAFSSCRKVSEGDLSNENPTAGTSYIGIPSGMSRSLFFEPFTDIKKVDVFTIKKDAANPADLQKAQTIVLKAIPAALDGTEYEWLPSDVYTIANPNSELTVTGQDLSFKFAPGDFQKTFTINLNGAKFSKKYALAYQITTTDGLAVHAASKDTMIVTFGIKNEYDGDYKASGVLNFPDGTSRPWDDRDKTLTTIDLSTNETEAADLGGNGFFMYLKVNSDNTVTITPAPGSANQTIQNFNGTSTYDPGTKTYTLFYKYVGGTGDRVITETIHM